MAFKQGVITKSISQKFSLVRRTRIQAPKAEEVKEKNALKSEAAFIEKNIVVLTNIKTTLNIFNRVTEAQGSDKDINDAALDGLKQIIAKQQNLPQEEITNNVVSKFFEQLDLESNKTLNKILNSNQ